jgi:dTDP-4-amino-4,6-dideoxygalactose transaminase
MKVPYFMPWINDDDRRSVQASLEQRWLTNGPLLQKFENRFSKYIGTNFSLGVGSATQALHLALRAINIQKQDEIIVPTFTFAATANAASYCGAKPILTDVTEDTFTIDPTKIRKKITKRTKAIIVVHYGGQSCDMDEIKEIARSNGIKLIEDCAHSLGTTYKHKMCGNIGDVGCFSFYPTKIITTGEGGMVTTNKSEIYKKVRILRSQGMDIFPEEREKKATWKYDVVDLGYNYRLDEIRSALGLSQFRRVNQINNLRIKIAKKYNNLLQKIKGITVPATKPDRNHIYHLYSIKIEKEYPLTRDELFIKLYKNGIGTSVQYYPLHLMTYNKDKFSIKDFPISNQLKDQILCLPIYPTMTEKQIKYVVSKLL